MAIFQGIATKTPSSRKGGSRKARKQDRSKLCKINHGKKKGK